MTVRQFFWGIFLLFQFALPAAAQQCTHTLTGVVQMEGGVALPGATLSISQAKQTISAEDGSFTFEGLCPGAYTVTAHYVGFEKRTVQVKVPSTGSITVVLAQASTQLEDVVIEGEPQRTSVSQTVGLLQKEDLEALHGKPLGESLKEIPGVNAIQTGPSIFKPVIHGLHSQRILILNNGIRQEGQ